MRALGVLSNEALADEVRSIVRAAKRGAPVEDSRVELKGKVELDPEKAAGQIAGHANAAQGEHILWVIGLDENGQVRGATKAELSKWYPSVKRRFDGPAPSLSRSVSVPIDGKTVLALIFGTGDFPYVVKRSDGRKDVPWREGTGTRSAHRHELVRMLSRRMQVPDVDVLECRIRADQGSDKRDWYVLVEAQLYIRPSFGAKAIVIPKHRCSASIAIPNLLKETPLSNLRFSNESIYEDSVDFLVRRASPLTVSGSATLLRKKLPQGDAALRIVLEPAGWSFPIVVVASAPFDGDTH